MATTLAERVQLDERSRPRRPVHRWRMTALVAIVGAFLSIALAGYMAKRPGVYWSQVNVLFLAPKSTANPNGLQSGSSSLIAMAGIVGKQVGAAESGAQTASASVTLVGLGVRHGYSVRLPNDGGQWATNFDKALLDVQAVGTTVTEVTATMKRVLAAITRALQGLQTEQAVDPVNYVRTQLNPSAPPVYYEKGSSLRAALATMILGGGLTVAIALALYRRRGRSSGAAR